MGLSRFIDVVHCIAWDVVDPAFEIIISLVDADFIGKSIFDILSYSFDVNCSKDWRISNFLSNDVILDIAYDLLFNNVTVSPFHKRPAKYILLALFSVFVSTSTARPMIFGKTLESFLLSVPQYSVFQNLSTKLSRFLSGYV